MIYGDFVICFGKCLLDVLLLTIMIIIIVVVFIIIKGTNWGGLFVRYFKTCEVTKYNANLFHILKILILGPIVIVCLYGVCLVSCLFNP
jgi:hypothetical protein